MERVEVEKFIMLTISERVIREERKGQGRKLDSSRMRSGLNQSMARDSLMPHKKRNDSQTFHREESRTAAEPLAGYIGCSMPSYKAEVLFLSTSQLKFYDISEIMGYAT